MNLSDLPSGELITQGLRDLEQGNSQTIAATRLREAGLGIHKYRLADMPSSQKKLNIIIQVRFSIW